MSFNEPPDSRLNSRPHIFEITRPVVIDTLSPPEPFVSPGTVDANITF